jgi:hypothetical protein
VNPRQDSNNPDQKKYRSCNKDECGIFPPWSNFLPNLMSRKDCHGAIAGGEKHGKEFVGAASKFVTITQDGHD